MESKQQPNLVMKGYETYAVLKGGEKVIQFSDNSDIVTDKEASAVLTSSMRHPKQKSHLDGSKSDLIARCFSLRKSVFVK